MQTWDAKRCRGGAVSRHFRLVHRVHDAPGSLEVVPMTTDEQGIVAHLEALDVHMDLTISLSKNLPASEVNQNAKDIRGMFGQMGCSAQFQSGPLHEVLRHLYGICSSSVMPVHPLMFPGLVTDDEAFLRKVYRVVARVGDGTVGALREYGHELYPRVRAHVVGLLDDCHEAWARHEISFFSLVASSMVFEHVVPRGKQGYFQTRVLQEELEVISEVSIIHALFAVLTHPADAWFEEGFCGRLAALVKGCLDSCKDDAEGGAFRAVSQRVLLLMWWSRNAQFYVTRLPSVNLVFLERYMASISTELVHFLREKKDQACFRGMWTGAVALAFYHDREYQRGCKGKYHSPLNVLPTDHYSFTGSGVCTLRVSMSFDAQEIAMQAIAPLCKPGGVSEAPVYRAMGGAILLAIETEGGAGDVTVRLVGRYDRGDADCINCDGDYISFRSPFVKDLETFHLHMHDAIVGCHQQDFFRDTVLSTVPGRMQECHYMLTGHLAPKELSRMGGADKCVEYMVSLMRASKTLSDTFEACGDNVDDRRLVSHVAFLLCRMFFYANDGVREFMEDPHTLIVHVVAFGCIVDAARQGELPGFLCRGVGRVLEQLPELEARVIKFSRCVMHALACEPEKYLSSRMEIGDRLMIRMSDRMLAEGRFNDWVQMKQSPMMSIVETLSFYESLIGLYELPGRDRGYQHRLLTSCGILVRAPMERVRCKENLGRTICVYSAERQSKTKPNGVVLDIPKEHADDTVWVVDLVPTPSTAACGGAGKSERDVKAMAARADDAAQKLLEELQEEEAAASARQGKAASKNAQKKERERARQVQLKEERARAEAERVLWEEAEERDRKQRERVEERVRIKAARASWHKKKGPKLPVMVPGKERKGRVELARRAECIICLCVGVTHCVLPCLHAVYCEGCARMQEARGADRCPVCSAPGGGKAHSCRIDLHIDSESLLFPSGDFV